MEFDFKGVHVSQTIGIQEYFKKILPDFNRIIEIGTYNGGLTLFLHTYKNCDCDLVSYDINSNFNKVSKEYGIDFRIGDCFSTKIVNEIKELITNESKRVLLLCDGGSKNSEFNLYCKYLKCNDVIMLHDYCESLEDFKKIAQNIGWKYKSESSLSEINESINKYNLSKFYYDEFKSVLWGSFIKTNK